MVSAKPGAMYKYICIKKSVAFERTVWKLYLQHQLVSGAYNMQIWEAETLHMSQLAGGWDFLMLSGWRCASKKKRHISSQTIMKSCGGCVLQLVLEVQPCWAGLGGTDGLKARRKCWNLPRSSRIQQGSCRSWGSLDSPQQRDCINSLLMLLVLITAGLTQAGDGSSSTSISACRATRVQQNVGFF